MSHDNNWPTSLPYLSALIWGVDADGNCLCHKGSSCRTAGKHPITTRRESHGVIDQLIDLRLIPTVYHRHSWQPYASEWDAQVVAAVRQRFHAQMVFNRGLTPVPSRLLALDSDVKGKVNGMEAIRDLLPGLLDPARNITTVLTPSRKIYGGREERGHHFYLAGHPRLTMSKRTLKDLGWELFTGYGDKLTQLVAPGSVTGPGKVYEYANRWYTPAHLTEDEVDVLLQYMDQPNEGTIGGEDYTLEQLRAVPHISQISMPDELRADIARDVGPGDRSDHMRAVAQGLRGLTEVTALQMTAILSDEQYGVSGKAVVERGSGPDRWLSRAQWVRRYQANNFRFVPEERARAREGYVIYRQSQVALDHMFGVVEGGERPGVPSNPGPYAGDPGPPPPSLTRTPASAPTVIPPPDDNVSVLAPEDDPEPEPEDLIPDDPLFSKEAASLLLKQHKDRADRERQATRKRVATRIHREIFTLSEIRNGENLVDNFVLIPEVGAGCLAQFGPLRGKVYTLEQLRKIVRERKTMDGAGAKQEEIGSIEYFQKHGVQVSGTSCVPNAEVLVTKAAAYNALGQTTEAQYFNTWNGYAHPDPFLSTASALAHVRQYEDLQVTLKAIEDLAEELACTTGDPEVDAEQLLWWWAWFGSVVFRGDIRPAVQLLHICLSEGLGRGTWVLLFRTVLGLGDVHIVGTLEDMDAPYSLRSGSPPLVSVEECGLEKSRLYLFEAVKARMTAESSVINVKYGASYEVENNSRYFLASNRSAPLPLDTNSRRIFVMHHPWMKVDVKDMSPAQGAVDHLRKLLNRIKRGDQYAGRILSSAFWAAMHKHYDPNIDIDRVPHTLGLRSLARAKSVSASDYTASEEYNTLLHAVDELAEHEIDSATRPQLIKLVEVELRTDGGSDHFMPNGDLNPRTHTRIGKEISTAVRRGHVLTGGQTSRPVRWLRSKGPLRPVYRASAEGGLDADLSRIREDLFKTETLLLENGVTSLILSGTEERDDVIAQARELGLDWMPYANQLLPGLPSL